MNKTLLIALSAAVMLTMGTSAMAADGKAIYGKTCSTCHDAGLAGAPKLGDQAAWQPRIEQGQESLYHSALNGKGIMPPKGGNASLSEEDVKAAVDYMVSQAQ